MREWPSAMISSTASWSGAAALMAIMSMRGTMTSCTRLSLSSMTALIICSSSASRMPCWPPRSTISLSSSVVIAWGLIWPAPKSRVTALVAVVRSHTMGPSRLIRNSIGAANRSAAPSVWASASDLGTSSPKTIVKRARRRVTTRRATGSAVLPRSGCSSVVISSVSVTAVKAAARKPTNVTPTWTTAR